MEYHRALHSLWIKFEREREGGGDIPLSHDIAIERVENALVSQLEGVVENLFILAAVGREGMERVKQMGARVWGQPFNFRWVSSQFGSFQLLFPCL